MNTSSPIRVILVDDHLLFRIGLRSAFEGMDSPVTIVAEADSFASFFELLPQTQADLVLLDINLPDVSGVEIARRLRVEYPEIKILMLSSESDSDTIGKLMEIGINGFIGKGVPLDELERAVEYVAYGAEYYGRDIARIIHDVKIARNSPNITFTQRESEIIEMCAHGKSGKEIAAELNVSLKTVEAHKNNIFKKMGISSSVELVRYALKYGIISL